MAQIETQSLLCLSRAEFPYSSTIRSAPISFRGVSKIASKKSSSARSARTTFTVDIDSLIKREDSNELRYSAPTSYSSPSIHAPIATVHPMLAQPMSHGPPPLASQMSHHHMSPMPPRGGGPPGRRNLHPPGMEPYQQQPVKKQSKWSPEEDALIIELRGSGMKWDDVSKRLPGRSSISCRLHYQNYLERRSEWDEERKNKLARLYDRYESWIRRRYDIPAPAYRHTPIEFYVCVCIGPANSCSSYRFKAEMWAKVAEELAVPWRAAEAMHWQLGETDMARRAGQTPFTLAAVNAEAAGRNAQIRGHAHSQSQESVGRDMRASPPQSSYGVVGGSRPPSVMSRRDTMPIGHAPLHSMSAVTSVPQQQPPPPPPPGDYTYKLGPGLPPIQQQPQPRVPGPLPGVAELTTGMTPYTTPPPAHLPGPPPPPQSMHPGMAPPHGHQQQGGHMYIEQDHNRLKRPGSPDRRLQEGNYRRRME